MDLNQLKKWHETRKGHLVFGFGELILAYIFGSLAIDSASIVEYLFTFVLIFGGLKNLYHSIIKSKHETRSKS